MKEYYFIGEYNQRPVYYNINEGLLLENRLDDLVKPSKKETKIIINKFGGIKGIELIIKKVQGVDKNNKNTTKQGSAI